MTAERDALAELVAVHDEIRDVGHCETARLNAAWAAARSVLAAQPEPSAPREPTQAMIDAAANMHFEMAAHCSRGPDYPDVWRAMWDAAQPDNDQSGGDK